MHQLGFPSEVTAQEIERETSLGGAISLCAKVAGQEAKQVQAALRLDKAQWSRWESGQEGVIWPKLIAVMDHCGNDAPLLWMNFARGYDLSAMRKRETDLEKQNRQLREENAALKRVLQGAMA